MNLAGSGFALWHLPLPYISGFILCCLLPARTWRLAQISALAAVVASLAAGVLLVRGLAPASSVLPALLIATISWVIVSFSRDYLRGEARQSHYAAALMFTLASVMTVVVADHLGILLAAWVATSLGLHRLLLFYPERIGAQMAAHKKFFASRLAELSLLLAVLLIFHALDTFSISALTETLADMPELTPALNLAAVLIALAVILKSAQLPLHGWLIQVMEAPTPVSALLHAGIVNLGGILIIRLAPLFSGSTAAQTLLVLVGGLTALLAGVAMLTRISIKVRLAWSTCAQMGFMLMECGLGLYELAMLHLLAHSLYKAHAFLSASGAVQRARADDLLPAPVAAADASAAGFFSQPLLGALMALFLVKATLLVYGLLPIASHVNDVIILILALGCAPLLTAGWRSSRALAFAATLRATGIIALFLVWHTLFSMLLPTHATPPAALVVLASMVFISFYCIQTWIASRPEGVLAERAYGMAFAGFYLDEKVTRLTCRLWPLCLRRQTPAFRDFSSASLQGVAQ